jgi:hypothetical protein
VERHLQSALYISIALQLRLNILKACAGYQSEVSAFGSPHSTANHAPSRLICYAMPQNVSLAAVGRLQQWQGKINGRNQHAHNPPNMHAALGQSQVD